MVTWIADIKRDMLIGMNWINKTDLVIKKEKMEFNILEDQIFE